MSVTGRHLLRLSLAAILTLTILSGCGSMATRKDFYEPITTQVRAGVYDSAAVGLEAAKSSGKFGKKDRLVYYLDAGLAYHYAGQYDSSNARLHAAETAAEELFTRSISKAALSLVLNDNALDYAGEDHEILYTNLISALNYLAADNFEDAFVEIRRVNHKLEQLEKKYADAALAFRRGAAEDADAVKLDYTAKPVRFHNSAFARYLSMHMYAATGKYSDADLDQELLQHAFSSQPFIYDFEQPEVIYESGDGGVLSVVALVGLSPVKEALNLRVRTDKDLDLVQILYDDPDMEQAEYGHLSVEVEEDYYFKFSIPELIDRLSSISRIEVYASGEYLGSLQLLEDVGTVARETFKAKKSLIYLRSVARAVTKGLIAHKKKQKSDTGGLAGWLKKAAIDAVMDVIENADLRCARLLPGRIFVGDFVLTPGSYDLTVEFIDQSGERIGGQSFPGYRVTKHGLNLVEAVMLN
ncbi:MAG: hypothetical protein J7J98_08830 [candidate division Zixibacteria bacterium]|nr:hypothetical protein [candidate division Zixibacteria bacterium]